MKKNVGDFDAYMRLVCGFSALGYGIMRRNKVSIFLGSMKIAEGITRWCPMLAMANASTAKDEDCVFRYKYEEEKVNESADNA